MPDPQRPVKTIAIALDGQAVNVDLFKQPPPPLPSPGSASVVSEFENYVPAEDIDYTDLSKVNQEIQLLRIRLHRIRIELKTSERKALGAKYAYESEKKRKLISLSGGSVGEREAIAELLCEDKYSVYLVATAVAKEIGQHARDLRTELDALKEISNNLRRSIDLQ